MSNHAVRPRRILAGTLAGALALSVLPILGFMGVASAQEVAEPIGAGNFCEDVPQTEPFTDVQTTDPSFGEIVCLVATEITTGVTATTYEPNSFVTRRQMALFLTRLASEADRLEVGDSINELPAPTAPTFSDVSGESQFVKDAISQLDQAGVAAGFPDNTYRPGTDVSRRQMAAFIDRLYAFLTGAALPNSATDHFADDNADSAAAQESTNAVAEAGIFIGNPDGTFRPADPISRRQMANVLTRTLQVLFENGEITAWAAEGASNQSFTVAGAEAAHEAGAAGTRTCIVTGLTNGTQVDARIYPSENLTTSGSTVLFRDANSNNVADEDAVSAVISAVNGAVVAPNAEQNNITVISGALAISITGTGVDDVTLVVSQDTTGLTADAIDLTVPTVANANPKAPAEAFGVGCRTQFIPAEAALGNYVGADSDVVNYNLNYFIDTGLGATFNFDANDVFQYQGILSLTMAQFEGVLSSGAAWDEINVGYNPDAAGVSTFNITTDFVAGSTGVTATVFNADAGATINDLRVTFTPSTLNGPGTVYDVVADTTNDGAITATDTVLAGNITATPAADGTVTLTFNNVPNGTYDILVRAENPATGQLSGIDDSADVTVPGSPDTTRPSSIGVVTTTVGGLANTLDTGDVFKAVFNEAMAAPAAGSTIRVQDGDAAPSVGDIICGTNATCTLNAAAEIVNGVSRPANTVLTVTLTGAPTVVTAGTAAGIQLPATVIDSSGIRDTANNLWNLATSTDVIINGAFGS